MPVLRGVRTGQDAKLLEGIHRYHAVRAAGHIVAGIIATGRLIARYGTHRVHSVDTEAVGCGAQAADHELAAAVLRIREGHARRQRNQILETPPIQRHVIGKLPIHQCAHRCIARLEQIGAAAYVHTLGRFAHLKGKIHLSLLCDFEQRAFSFLRIELQVEMSYTPEGRPDRLYKPESFDCVDLVR